MSGSMLAIACGVSIQEWTIFWEISQLYDRWRLLLSIWKRIRYRFLIYIQFFNYYITICLLILAFNKKYKLLYKSLGVIKVINLYKNVNNIFKMYLYVVKLCKLFAFVKITGINVLCTYVFADYSQIHSEEYRRKAG